MNFRLFSQLLNRPLTRPNLCNVQRRCLAKNADIVIKRSLDFDAESLEARGYHRYQKPYTPPDNVDAIIDDIFEDFGLIDFPSDASMKFRLLNACFKTIGHCVPNSSIHNITSRETLSAFYNKGISVTFPLEMMQNIDLPKNLHITYNYTRFHPETDTHFDGISAFPGSSTIMTDIKAKKKYPGYIAKKLPSRRY